MGLSLANSRRVLHRLRNRHNSSEKVLANLAGLRMFPLLRGWRCSGNHVATLTAVLARNNAHLDPSKTARDASRNTQILHLSRATNYRRMSVYRATVGFPSWVHHHRSADHDRQRPQDQNPNATQNHESTYPFAVCRKNQPDAGAHGRKKNQVETCLRYKDSHLLSNLLIVCGLGCLYFKQFPNLGNLFVGMDHAARVEIQIPLQNLRARL